MEWDYNYVIAIDYDGTLCKDRKNNIFNDDIVEFAKMVKRLGCVIILWTSRCDYELQEAIDLCASKGLYFDYINEYPKRTKSPKICADMYIDNKSMLNGKIPIKRFYKQVLKDIHNGNYQLLNRD